VDHSFNDIDSILASPSCDRERLMTSEECLPRSLNFYVKEGGDDFSTDDNFLELNSINFPEFGENSMVSTDEVLSHTTQDPLEHDNITPWNFSETSWYDLSRFEGLTEGGVCNGWWVE